MANEWLRLWHDMPNDPKWRTIARASGMPISLVQSTYVHMLVDASRNVTRGHVSVTTEDLASALDAKIEEIESIFAAMQGRVLDGLLLLGWEKRQPKREESGTGYAGPKTAAQRKKEQRDREKAEAELSNGSNGVAQCHAESRNVTLDKDKDKDKEEDKSTPIPPFGGKDAQKKSRAAFSLKTYLAECKAGGVKPIPEDDSVFDYASGAGISHEVLALHWSEFRDRYSLEGAKKYKAWRVVFGKSVRGNWFKLWYFDNSGNCMLTTAGQQAKNIAANRRAA
jgi:hypothetical protein